MTLRILSLPLAAMALAAFAYNITGIATDTGGEPLAGASVRLLKGRDSTQVKAVAADENGRFTLKDVATGRYLVEVSYISYTSTFTRVNVQKNLRLDTIRLAPDALTLGEATVTGVRTPVKVMDDTIEYNADAYKTAPNAVVEDLLKRLPGVEVGSDGKITSNGKEVTKILIDGKEFFSDDPKVASKNLPVNMIDKLQVVDRKSDLARITGVDDGEEETVINLTVKKGMKNGWFGNAEGGYGTDGRYQGSFNVNRFWNDNQVTLLGGLNNINQPGFTDGGQGRFRRFGGSGGLTTSKALGLNFNVGNGEIFRVGGDVMYSYTGSRTLTSQSRQYLFPDSTSYYDTDKYARDRGHNVRADFRLQWKPDSLNTFELRPSLMYNNNDAFATDSSLTRSGHLVPVTQSRNISQSNGKSWEFGAQLIYNHKFASRPGRAFSLMANFRSSNVREHEDAWSRNLFYLYNDSTDLYDQYQDNHTWSNTVSARATWTEPLGNPRRGNFLTLSYRMQYRWNNADRLTYDNPTPDPLVLQFGIAAAGGLDNLVFNQTLSNSFRNNYFNQDIRLGYKHVSRTTNLEAGISLVPQRSQSINLLDSDKSIPVRSTLNVAPYLRYRYKMSKSRSLNVNYRGRASQPSMTQLQPVADMSNPLRIVVGNPELDPTFTHNVQVRFQDFDARAQRSIMAMLMTNIVQNSIVSRTVFNATTGGQTTSYENVNGVWNAFLMAMFSQPFSGNRAWQISVHNGLRYTHGVGFNNGRRNTSSAINYNISPGLAWRPEHFEVELRPRYGISHTANSLQSTVNPTVHTYGGMFFATYNAPFGLVLQTDLNFSATKGYQQGYDTRQWMWNASVSYQFLRSRALTLTVKANDILQQVKSVNRNVTANYIDDTRYNTLGRYVMATVSYRFNTFGQGNQPQRRTDDMRRGPRPGGPGGPGGPR